MSTSFSTTETAATPSDRADRVCVIGAGSSGLTVLRHLKQLNLPADCLERDADVGGIWQFDKPTGGVYASTHLISSKRLTEYPDFPMPEEYPAYPSHHDVFRYFQSYARQFDLYDSIEFEQPVARVERSGSQWRVTLASGEVRDYGALVIANGHNSDPFVPKVPGHFDGAILHSHNYKTPDQLAGRRVLVMGAGNSGCDIAVESAQHAAVILHSTRRGYHYLPKFLFGKPADQCGERMLRWRLPLWLRRTITRVIVRAALGSPTQYGLPRPDHRLFETHPIINSQLYYYLGHGRIRPKPDVQELQGDYVLFHDGTREQVDLIIYATGYRISFPFIDPVELNTRQGRPDLFLNVFHPEHDNLFVAGLIQPDSGQWGLVHYQAQLIARYLAAQRDGAASAARFRARRAQGENNLNNGIRYIDSPRHLLEVEHFSYRKKLKKLIAEFD